MFSNPNSRISLNSGTISEINGNIATASKSDMIRLRCGIRNRVSAYAASAPTSTQSSVDSDATTRLFNMKRRIGCAMKADS